MNKNYSEWLKLDLHIHSDFSKKTKDNDYKGRFSVATLKEKMIENEVKIFSITDHNIINIDAYGEYYAGYSKETDPLLLLGVELDILVKRKKDRTYHTLLIFNCDNFAEAQIINDKLEGIYRTKGITILKERFVTLEDISKEFKDFDFFFIPHAYSEKSIVTAYKDGFVEEAQKMVLLMSCALEKVTHEETIEAYNSGFNKLLTTSFQSKDDIPYINFSDNHCIENYPCRHKGDNGIGNHDFYYIKGSKNFESIRLAFIDPMSRIKTSEQFNSINHLNNTIEFLRIEDAEYIKKAELNFSPHLNVIIGGRSSGKSLLMWLIGRKIKAPIDNSKYNKYEQIPVLVKSKNDSNYVEHTVQNDYIYIKQGDIINYFEKGKLNELAKKSRKNEDYEQCKHLFRVHKEELSSILSDFIETYRKVYDSESAKNFILYNKTIDSILSDHFIIKYDKEIVKSALPAPRLLTDIEDLLARIKQDVFSLLDYKILNFNDDENRIIKEFESLLQLKTQLLSNHIKLNSRKNIFINNVNSIVQEYNGTLNREAREKEQAGIELEFKLRNLAVYFNLLRKLKNSLNEFEHFVLDYKQSIAVERDIKLVLDSSIKTTVKDIILDSIKDSDTNQSLFLNILSLLEKSKTIKNLGGNSPDDLKRKINTNLKEVYNSFDDPKDYLEYEDGEISMDKSPGFNSEKYLNIVLKNPDIRIVFIDQPEDNLGNKFIADTLVKLIRELKFSKQIFLVTHNPSVVVYGDAESVILAKNDANIISYEQIVLESSDNQKKICEILDGGEYIFNNRYKKYNIQRILK